MTRLKKTRKLNSPMPKRKVSRFEMDSRAKDIKKQTKRTLNAGARNNIGQLQNNGVQPAELVDNKYKPSKTKLISLHDEDDILDLIPAEILEQELNVEYVVKNGILEEIVTPKQKAETKLEAKKRIAPEKIKAKIVEKENNKATSKPSIKETKYYSSMPISAENNVAEKRKKIEKPDASSLLSNWHTTKKQS